MYNVMMATSDNWISRKKGKKSADLFKLDTKNKTPEENIVEIIKGLYVKQVSLNEGTQSTKVLPEQIRTVTMIRALKHTSSDGRRMSYLTALVTLLSKEDRNTLGFTTEELMTCIRVSLVDDSVVIRGAALRALRYLIRCESDVAVFNALKLPYLLIRSMDLVVRNEEERAQALRVVRRVVAVVGLQQRRARGAFVEPGLLRCLAAIAKAGVTSDGDRLARPAVATLAEIGVINPVLVSACGGVGAVSRGVWGVATPRMAEALCGALLHLLDAPRARHAARLDLRDLAAPYCDFTTKNHCDDNRDEREMRFTCARLSLLCVLRSWPGVLHFCRPNAAGGLAALVAALHLPRLEVRKAILDLLYELLELPQPDWTDEMSVALGAVDPADFQDSWRLSEDFVCAEGEALLASAAAAGPDAAEIHLALLLHCFLQAGLLDGLVEVIVTSDTFISVRATVLLGQLLHLTHILLPPQICNITPPLPSLIAQATAGKPQALAAIAALKRLQSMLEARPATSSIFLDHIVQCCSGAYREKVDDNSKSKKEKDNANMASPRQTQVSLYTEQSMEFLNESENEYEPKRHSIGSRADVSSKNVGALVKSKSVSSRTSAAVSKVAKAKFFNLFDSECDSLMRASLVMHIKDGNTWNWEIIRTILKGGYLRWSDSTHRLWAGRLVGYLTPSRNLYSHADLPATPRALQPAAACMLLREAIQETHPEVQRMMLDFFEDVSQNVAAIDTGRKAHECLFSPQHMCNTMCQTYFLFVGQLCHTQAGLALFKQTKLCERLLDLATKTHHSCYVKLVISSLDYTLDSYPRDILAKTLVCNVQGSRLYATQFLNVLLRASQKGKELLRKKMKWRKQSLQDHKLKDDDKSNGDMETWILQLLVGQLKDVSKDVVKSALTILEEACHVPSYLDKLIGMRETFSANVCLDFSLDPQSVNLNAVGDRAYLLWLRLQVGSLANCSDQTSINFLKKHLDYWTRFYNYRYVRLVESEVHATLTLGGAGGGEDCGRRNGRARASPPYHLHRDLAVSHPNVLASTLLHHNKIVRAGRCSTEQETMELKSSMWAVGQACSTTGALGAGEAAADLVKLARTAAVYSVRAAALLVLSLLAADGEAAKTLEQLGWFSVRNTRNDQFPIIEDDLGFGSPSVHHNYIITSPVQRRLAPRFDLEISEHSDQSTAESVHSDATKTSGNRSITVPVECHAKKSLDTVDAKTNFLPHDKRKSHTLPTQGYSHDKPSSLSESRTVDTLRDYSSFDRPYPIAENRLMIGRLNSLDAHEGRVRNTSESSTSGVSSCDSMLGRYALPERVVTLSPIPSSSSAGGRRAAAAAVAAGRPLSNASFTTPEVMNSPPSQKDMAGYATLKSLNKHRRPHLSESAASGPGEAEELSWIVDASVRRSKPFSSLRDRGKATKERMAKMSLLQYDWKPIWGSGPPSAGIGRTPGPAATTRPAAAPGLTHQYRGLCLPINIMDLFPRGNGADNSLESFATDSGHMLEAAPEARHLNLIGEDSSWQHLSGECLRCDRAHPPSAQILREAFFAELESGSEVSSPARPAAAPASPPAQALHHVRYMANPIYHKSTRPALIALKQAHPEVFRSLCVYSDVCALLSSGTYMACARRFVQELFLDVDFDSFASEPRNLLARKNIDLSPSNY